MNEKSQLSTCIKPVDNLQQTCYHQAGQAMGTHPDIDLMTARQQACSRLAATRAVWVDRKMFCCQLPRFLEPVVRKVDGAIHWIINFQLLQKGIKSNDAMNIEQLVNMFGKFKKISIR